MTEKTQRGRFEQAYDNEWFELPDNTLRQMCCSCGLVHDWTFKGAKKGDLKAKVSVDRRATRYARKKYNVKLKGSVT